MTMQLAKLQVEVLQSLSCRGFFWPWLPAQVEGSLLSRRDPLLMANSKPSDQAFMGEAKWTLPRGSRRRASACRLLMDRPLGLEDLKDVHPEIYNSLKRLLVHEGDVAEMSLYFQVPHRSSSPACTLAICSVSAGRGATAARMAEVPKCGPCTIARQPPCICCSLPEKVFC